MAIVSDEAVYEDEFEAAVATLPPDIRRVYITAKEDAAKPAGEDSPEPVRPEPFGLNPPERGPGILPAPVERPPAKPVYTLKSGLVITDHDIEDATNVAMSFGTGTMGGVKAAGKLNTKNDLGHAQLLEQNLVHPDDVYTTTGWFRGADNRWRYEIDDSVAKYNTEWADKPAWSRTKTATKEIEEVLDHPALYKAYPELKGVKVSVDSSAGNGARWDAETRTIFLGPEAVKNKGTVLHEVQHVVQDVEGFARGGAPALPDQGVYKLKYEEEAKVLLEERKVMQNEWFKGKLPTAKEIERYDYLHQVSEKYIKYLEAAKDKAIEYYARLAGETEARNVATRVDMDSKWRRSVPPSQTEDVARRQQIVRMDPEWTTPYGVLDSKTGEFVKPRSSPKSKK